MAGISFDISQFKSQESSLIFENKKLRFIMDHIVANLPGHVYWQDTRGVIRGCNQRQAEAMGCKSAAEVIDKRPEDFLPR